MIGSEPRPPKPPSPWVDYMIAIYLGGGFLAWMVFWVAR